MEPILLRADRAGERADQLLARLVPELTRSAAQRLLEAGAVTLGGRPVKKNDKAAVGDVLEVRLPEPEPVDELPQDIPLDIVYEDGDVIVVNKPVGMVVHPAPGHSDGTLVNALTHPRHEIEKHYEVRVRGRLDNIPRLEEPMEIDGYAIRPARVVILEQDSESAKLRLTIHEGRNRQIRKMCEQCGLEVRRLKRVAVGELPLDPALKAGAWRELTPEEVAYLRGVGAILQD